MIAWNYINDKATAAVIDLLDGESLRLASNWADDIRDDVSFDWTKPLHYVNVSKTATTVDLSQDCSGDGCVISAIEKFSAILKDKTNPKAEQAEALRFLIHRMEDVHQPMHASYTSDMVIDLKGRSVAMEAGTRFAIRQGGRTLGAGTVSRIRE